MRMREESQLKRNQGLWLGSLRYSRQAFAALRMTSFYLRELQPSAMGWMAALVELTREQRREPQREQTILGRLAIET